MVSQPGQQWFASVVVARPEPLAVATHCRLWSSHRQRGKSKKMKNQISRGFLRSVLVIGVLVVAGACSKRSSQSQATPANSAPATNPAAVAGKASQPSPGADSLPAGIELGKLDEFKRKVFDQVVNREPSACGKGHSLLYSVKHDSSCRASFYAVRYVARLADSGFSDSEIGEKVEQRFRASRVPYIDVSQAPSKGAPSGRVTIVEFVDYECDHCKQAQGLMHTLLAEYAKDLTLYFKHFPFSSHINALNAALAAAAAQNQGKFWQFNDKVWENSDQLRPALLEALAKEVTGLDFARWYHDVGSEDVRAHVLRDRTEGRALEIHQTPAIFINGRRYSDELDVLSLKDWIDEALGR
jgi:predicted DsbA family dithiol-disulfide isomerase